MEQKKTGAFQKELEKQRRKPKVVEPTVNLLTYREDMQKAANWYNQNCESDSFRDYFREHFQDRIDFSLTAVHSQEYRISGMLVRILGNGNALDDAHTEKIESEFLRIQALAKTKKEVEVKEEKPKVDPQVKINEKISAFMAEFNALVDVYCTDRTMPNSVALLRTMGITGAMTAKIAEKIAGPIKELVEALEGKDPQLNEGYSFLKKPELRKLLLIYTTLDENLKQAKVMVVRKPRAKKEIPPAVLCKNMKLKKDDPELKLQSVSVTNIIGASEIWVYNTKYKTLTNFVAMGSEGLSVKGTSVVNFDTAKSLRRTIRKPEMLAPLQGQGKRTFAAYCKTLTTKEHPASPRLNDDCILISAYK